MPRRIAIVIAAVTATTGLVAGCGGGSSGGSTPTSNNSSLSPAAELSSAVSSLGDAQTLTASLELGASGSQLLSFVKDQDSSAHLTAQQASEIAGLQLTFEVAAASGRNLSSLSGLSNSGSTDISLVDNGKDLLSLRLVQQVLYIQADLKDILNDLNQASAYRQITSAAGQLPPFMTALVNDKWIKLPLSTLKSLGSQLGAGTPPSASSGKSNQFIDALKSLLTKDVTVTRTSSGSSDQLTLTANLRKLAGDITTTLGNEIPGAGSVLGKTDLSNVPDKSVTLDATVTDGSLSALSFDLGQIAKSGQRTLPLQLSFAKSGPDISAPSGAVAVDLSSLGSLLGAFAQGFSG